MTNAGLWFDWLRWLDNRINCVVLLVALMFILLSAVAYRRFYIAHLCSISLALIIYLIFPVIPVQFLTTALLCYLLIGIVDVRSRSLAGCLINDRHTDNITYNFINNWLYWLPLNLAYA